VLRKCDNNEIATCGPGVRYGWRGRAFEVKEEGGSMLQRTNEAIKDRTKILSQKGFHGADAPTFQSVRVKGRGVLASQTTQLPGVK